MRAQLIEALLVATTKRETTGLTLWKTPEGWQANLQRDNTSWRVAFNADPLVALLEVLTGSPVAVPLPGAAPKSVFD